MKDELIYGLMLLVFINCVLAGFLIFKVADVSKTVDVIEDQLHYQHSSQKENKEELRVEIWRDEDYNIHRTGVGENVDSLILNILYNGEMILSKNALNETVYHSGNMPGTYTFYVTSIINGKSKVVSNVESYYID